MLRIAVKLAFAGVAIAASAVIVLSAAAGSQPGPGQRIVFPSNRADGERDLYVVNEDGSGEHRVTFDGNAAFERAPSWSPDGSRLAFAALTGGNWDIYTTDANGGDRRRITTDPARDDYPRWTSDGRILFTRGFPGCPCTEWVANADGTNPKQLNLQGNVLAVEGSPHGDRIVYNTFGSGSDSLHVAQLSGATITGDVRITAPPAGGEGDFEPHWSPNGSDIVFLRDTRNVDNDIFVVHVDGSGLKRLTSTPNRVEFGATWSSDGKDVLFLDGTTQRIKAISVASGLERNVSTTPRAPFTEDFSGTARDASLWHEINDPGGSIAQVGGRLVATISGSAVPGGQFNQVDEHFGSQCSIHGDFDYQVDYELLTWPHDGGFRANLAAFFVNASIGRASVPIPYAPNWSDEQVQGFSDGGGGQFMSNDNAGTLRLVRRDGVVYGYVKHGDDWRPAFSGTATNDNVYGMGLSAQASEFGHMDGAVAFDNFKLASGAFTCPDWWSDGTPDVQFG
jgi:hypothetical protein